MVFSNDIATHIFNADLGYSPGVNIFESRLPGTPVNAVAIYETGGTSQLADKYITEIRHPSFNILVRNDDYATGMTLAKNIKSEFHRLINRTVGNTFFFYCFAVGEPRHLGQDEQGADLISIDFDCKVRNA